MTREQPLRIVKGTPPPKATGPPRGRMPERLSLFSHWCLECCWGSRAGVRQQISHTFGNVQTCSADFM
ncbi:hypothetical protein NDU88_000599 [Pleurodeles waltl]|uniref:Uncharacterized protein n=1 Tax=Pleurodeles waltl TaxID=8319 RepID=A0AAV7L8V0_PLEWA|nr:hypothetical protein NDU88_000599 [Pleurodeles waltl]